MSKVAVSFITVFNLVAIKFIFHLSASLLVHYSFELDIALDTFRVS